MKISELMVLLAKALQEHGDIEVVKSIGKRTEPLKGATIITPPRQPIRL